MPATPFPSPIWVAILAVWFGLRGRMSRSGFYLVFACAVTLSVQLVGLYLVFATLIVPALATRRLSRGRLAACYGLGAAGYAAGLLLSALTDLPTGPLIVCTFGGILFLAWIVFRVTVRDRSAAPVITAEAEPAQ